MSVWKEKFTSKIFTVFTMLGLVVFLAVSALFAGQQKAVIRENLIDTGRILAQVLAYNSRLAVFSENRSLLENAVQSILEQPDVLEVAVYNLESRCLIRKGRPRITPDAKRYWKISNPVEDKRVIQTLESPSSSLLQENGNCLEFWLPVTSGSEYSLDQIYFLDKALLNTKDRVIGYVKVALDHTSLDRQVSSLLKRGTLIGLLFIVANSLVTYFLARQIARPLKALTVSARALGKRGIFRKVNVETRDEIGKLAEAFNAMSDSLLQREAALKKSREELRYLSSQLLNAQEKERKRVSRELHDELGQSLALLKHRIRSLQSQGLESPLEFYQACEETKAFIDQTIESVRRISRDLSPAVLDDLGLDAALDYLVENFTQQHPIRMTVRKTTVAPLFSKLHQSNLYRFVQEAFTNISKHAAATHVTLLLERKGAKVKIVVEDNGRGFDVERVLAGRHAERGIGLAAMGERARMLGGSLTIESAKGEGCRICLTIPV